MKPIFLKKSYIVLAILSLGGCASTPPVIDRSYLPIAPNAAHADKTPTACVLSADTFVPATNRDAQALVRIPPRMPATAKRSGHCLLRFNVNKSGNPREIEVTSCSDDIFAASSIQSVSRWIYVPKREGGIAVDRCGVETKISYLVANRNGDYILE